jgi:polyisoprenoid-binding protein YceI
MALDAPPTGATIIRTLAAGLATAIVLAAVPAPAAAPSAVRAGVYELDKDHAKIIWGISHFGFSTYYGEFTDFDARLSLDPRLPARSRLSVTIRTASVDTNNPALDTHLKSGDFFDVARYPIATFTSTRIVPAGAHTARVTGNFTLHGVTKPITLTVNLNKAGIRSIDKAYVAGFGAEGTISRSAFGIDKYAGALGDEVKLIITGEFHPVK